MRILHTSDWHLGRQFHGTSLLAAQRRALARLADLVADHRVDVVLIAGDLYDRAVPPADAVALLDDALVDLRAAGATVIAITGNHDSPVRVGFGDRLLGAVGVTIRGDLRRAAEPVVVAGDDGGPPVAVYPVPYADPLTAAHLVDAPTGATDGTDRPRRRGTEPDDLPDADRADEDLEPGRPGLEAAGIDRQPGEHGRVGVDRPPARRSHDQAMAAVLDHARADLAQRGWRSVVVAHTFVNGARASASERELTVGNVDLVGLHRFDGFDYAALGHLHRPQSWRDGRVAYAGSLLPYSFSEEGDTKVVRFVDLAPDGSVTTELRPIGAGRPVRTLTGGLEQLLADPALGDAEGAFVRAVLTDRHLPLQAMRRLQSRFPHAVELRHEPVAEPDARLEPAPTATARRHHHADPYAVSVRFLHEQRGFPIDDTERELLGGAIEDARRSEAS